VGERYVLERILGEGGMGVVFAARHLELDETVAIKMLRPSETSTEENVERFLREARLASKIKNEHVVRIIDVARERGSAPPYIVMEYLDGIDLAELIARGPLSSIEAVDYVLQACEALAEAHALGIVHRDLKPSNLLLTRRPDGSPLLKVLDFGISKTHAGDDSKLTTTSAVFGSPAYMSPEQIRSAKNVDQRCDVWSLAVVLFELVTGRLPFEGDSAAAVLAAIAADPPLALLQLAPSAPPQLESALVACLVKNREKRVASVAHLADLLEPFASAEGRKSVGYARRILSGPRHVVSSSEPSSARTLGLEVTAKADAASITDQAIVVTTSNARRPRWTLLAGSLALAGCIGGITWLATRTRPSAHVDIASSTAGERPATEAASELPPAASATNARAPAFSAPTPDPADKPRPPRGAPSRPHPRPLASSSSPAAGTPSSVPPKPTHVDTNSRQ
jgi:serine/threonine-protein kinase